MEIKTVELAGQKRSVTTKRAILDAAAPVFSEKGYSQAVLGEILATVGLTKGAFYHHWKCKEDLAIELLSVLRDDYYRLAAVRLEEAATAWAQIEAMLELASELGAESSLWRFRRLWVALSFYLPPDVKRLQAESARGNEEYLGYWIQVIEAGQAEGSVRADLSAKSLAQTVFSSLLGVQMLQDADANVCGHHEMTATLRETLRSARLPA
jgi:AcrR family transcriptional regulator